MKFNNKKEREEFILKYERLVDWVLWRKLSYLGGMEREDLKQFGYIGLINAVDRFDENKGTLFHTYATHCIYGSIICNMRKEPMLRHNRDCLDNRRKATVLLEHMTEEEVAQKLNLTEQQIDEIKNINRGVLSLDWEYGNGENVCSLKDIMCYEHDYDSKIYLEQLLKILPKRNADILKKYFVDGFSQTEISKHVGISQVQVSRIIKKSLENLRKEI